MTAPTLRDVLDDDGRDELVEVPALPIEQPLVRATRELEAVKAAADSALLVLEHLSRDPAQLRDSMDAIVRHVNRASDAVWHLAHLRSTRGQA